MVKPVEQGMSKSATALAKGDKAGAMGRTAGADEGTESRHPAEVTSLARARARKSEPKSEIIDQIGQRLRNVYNEVLFQPVPDRFHELIATLEKDRATSGGDATAGEAGSPRKKDLK